MMKNRVQNRDSQWRDILKKLAEYDPELNEEMTAEEFLAVGVSPPERGEVCPKGGDADE
jgi:hypothetical protein